MGELIWFHSEPEYLAKLAHYKYSNHGLVHNTELNDVRRAFVTDRVFPAMPRGAGSVYLLMPGSELLLHETGGMLHYFPSREWELEQAGVNPNCGSWSVPLEHLDLVVPHA